MIDEFINAFEITRSLSHKGCPYDNAVAESTYKIFKTEFVMPCVINVTEWGLGESRNAAPLAFDAMSRGKPSFIEASAG